MMNQKEAVYAAVTGVMGKCDGKYEPTKDQRGVISQILIEGFNNGSIQLNREYDVQGLKDYVSGLLSNWLRKDTRLNGGTKYEPQNPGTRVGQGDAQLVAMRALLSTLTDPADRAEVQKHIDARIEELKPKVTIDYSKLPADLLAKFKK